MPRKRSNLRLITFKIDEDLLIRLDTLSKNTGKCRSELIRAAIQMYIQQNNRQMPRIIIIEK
jgi:metal-responsive CopG/Arc/MetJ family transcriptional regulator